MMFKKSLIACLGLFLSVAASAEVGYFGLSVGQTDVDLPGFDKGDSIALNVGFNINENFAIEGSFIDLGDSSNNSFPVLTAEAGGINIAGVGIFPVNDNFNLFGKVGFLIWDASLDASGFGEIDSDDGTDISLGFGAAFNLTDMFALVFEYQMYEFGFGSLDVDVEADNISIGARFNF